jgi:hypothetical protein
MFPSLSDRRVWESIFLFCLNATLLGSSELTACDAKYSMLMVCVVIYYSFGLIIEQKSSTSYYYINITLPDFDLFEKMENAEAEMTPNLI